jgi:hypothetical protein
MEPGYYWATNKHLVREVIELATEDFEELRAWRTGYRESLPIGNFTDFDGPLRDPRPAAEKGAGE